MPRKKKNVITVSLDLDALRLSAQKCADANGGSLENSGGLTPINLDEAFDAMRLFFDAPNKEFGEAIADAIQVLVDNHTPTDD